MHHRLPWKPHVDNQLYHPGVLEEFLNISVHSTHLVNLDLGILLHYFNIKQQMKRQKIHQTFENHYLFTAFYLQVF